MKFIYVKDPHIRFGFNKPVSRTDTFFADIREKWKALCDYAYKNNIDTLAIPGDVLDKKTPSYYTFGILRQIIDFFEEFNCFQNIVTVPGNHDLPYSSVDNLKDSVYQYLVEREYIVDVTEHPCVSTGDVAFWGVPYVYPESEFFNRMDALHERMDTNQVNVVLTHAHIIPPVEVAKYVSFINYDALLKYGKVDVWLCGHFHLGYKPLFYENASGKMSYFYNAWNLSRMDTSDYVRENKHTPEFYVIDTKDLSSICRVELPHRPYVEAYTEQAAQVDHAVRMNLREFSESFKVMDLTVGDFLPGEDIKDTVKEYLDKAEHEIK